MIKNPIESRRIAAALFRNKLTFDEADRVRQAVREADTIEHLDPAIRELLAKAER